MSLAGTIRNRLAAGLPVDYPEFRPNYRAVIKAPPVDPSQLRTSGFMRPIDWTSAASWRVTVAGNDGALTLCIGCGKEACEC